MPYSRGWSTHAASQFALPSTEMAANAGWGQYLNVTIIFLQTRSETDLEHEEELSVNMTLQDCFCYDPLR